MDQHRISKPQLSQRTLDQAAGGVSRPAYARGELARGIVHLGLGAFHRAHQALYTEAVVQRGDRRWGIVGVSLRDPRTTQTLAAQDLLYSVTERHGDEAHTRVVGALADALYAPNALQQVVDAIADPAVTVVTSTVTEKGYSQNPASSDLDVDDAAIRHDVSHPDTPRSTLGVLAAGIRRRPAGAPLTIVCCDNMANNGDTLRKLLVQYAELLDPALARRIENDIALPNSMVDRIVPAATPESLAWAEQRLGLRDEAAIVCEPFTQWVIEDRFAGPRPAWEDAGALLTGDVRPYQAMKLRLLNGTHSAIAYAGQLSGLDSVSDAMADPLVGPFARGVMARPARHGRRAGWLRHRRLLRATAASLREPRIGAPHAADRDGRDAEGAGPLAARVARERRRRHRTALARARARGMAALPDDRAQRRREGACRQRPRRAGTGGTPAQCREQPQTQCNKRSPTPASSATCRGRRR